MISGKDQMLWQILQDNIMTIDEKRGTWRVWKDQEVVARFSSEKEAKKFVKESAAPAAEEPAGMPGYDKI